MKKIGMPTVWETYDGLVKKLRDDGFSLQAIGNEVGVTRERIRQILNEHYGTTKISGFTNRVKLAKVIGCSEYRLRKLEKECKINPIRHKWFYLYSKDEAEKAVLALQKNCVHCGESLPLKHQQKYCLKCRNDYKRYNYPFLSEEAKKKCREASKSWQETHPERTRELNKRAKDKYEAKRRISHEID